MRIDHITAAGTHLDAMRLALTAATQLPTEYGGPHANHATEMALVSFPDGSYLELIGIQPGADMAVVAAHRWGNFLRNNAGPCAFALLAEDLKARTPERSGRTRPDGVRLEWETAELGPGFPFLIRDITPRENRVFPGGKPTTVRFNGVGKAVIGVRNLESAVAQYRGEFGLAAPQRETNVRFGAGLAWFEGTPIMLAQGIEDSSWLTWRAREYGDAPCAFVLTATGDLAAAPGSSLFGSPVFWVDEDRLGWCLGIETAS